MNLIWTSKFKCIFLGLQPDLVEKVKYTWSVLYIIVANYSFITAA
jgi:hypothetical protein